MRSIAAADSAVRALQDVILDESFGPINIDYAPGENERLGLPWDNSPPGVDQCKLFVGSLPKFVTEEHLMCTFSHYGLVEEVYLMKDQSKVSKGCAFIKLNKEPALFAMEQLNGRHSFDYSWGNKPIEVRLAETRKGAFSSTFGENICPKRMNNDQEQIWSEHYNEEGKPYYYNRISEVSQWEKPQLCWPIVQNQSRPRIGPPGANLFIFHVPNEWTNEDLYSHFTLFGNVLSARIATDKSSGRNRGFAFVSFDDPCAAIESVQHMNGFQVIGNSQASGKRLKVMIKKGEEIAACQYREPKYIIKEEIYN
eukprot:GHVL01024562.1.p1 GENE.GHVL01024562.1~~GHVL01024562.1.p1  ORF type:complete len:310 (+),score=53.83 GHVL01024562.1:319-1248(+)